MTRPKWVSLQIEGLSRVLRVESPTASFAEVKLLDPCAFAVRVLAKAGPVTGISVDWD